MKTLRYLICLFLLAAPSAWASLAQPAPGAPAAIGAYAAGCVRGAQALEPDGPGYQLMRPGRGHYYGHPDLIAFIKKLALDFQAHHSRENTLLIGDLARPRGGPIPGLHSSHQTGLDVDIWFRLGEAGRRFSLEERDALPMPSLLKDTGAQINAAQINALRLAAEQAEVDRIFVNPHIKQAVCAHTTGQPRAWLRKLRPWWGHDAHFHVRLRCPAAESACTEQAPLPVGEGCDAELAWWFSEEARTKPPAGSAKRPPKPALPAVCRALLRNEE